MIYRFSKEKFNKNAPSNIKKRLKKILDDLDNLVVDFDNDKVNGTVDVILNGEAIEVYPVSVYWCTKQEQLKLI